MRKSLKAICAGAAVFFFVLGANVQPQVDGNEMVSTSDMWTADALGGIAIDKTMEGVVSDVVGISLESVELDTPLASARASLWDRIDLATINSDAIRASILKHTAGRKQNNHISNISSNNTITTRSNSNSSNGSCSVAHINTNSIRSIFGISWSSTRRRRNKLARFALTDNAALTCSTPGSAGGPGLAICIAQCGNKRSLVFKKAPRVGACHLLCALAVAPCDKHTSWFTMSATEAIDAIIDLAVPPQYSDTARNTLNTLHELYLSAYAGATTAAPVYRDHAKVALDATMDWLGTVCHPRVCSLATNIADIAKPIAVFLGKAVYRLLSLTLLGVRTFACATMNWLTTTLYPWARECVKDVPGTVTAKAASLSKTAYDSSSEGLSPRLELARNLTATAASGVANATALARSKFEAAVLEPAGAAFWASPAGKMVEDVMMPKLREVGTAFLDAVSEFWACPAVEVARTTVVTRVKKGAATSTEFMSHVFSAAVKGVKSLVKTHLLEDKPTLALLLVVVVRMACRYYKMRTARACTHKLGEGKELSKKAEAMERQASNLKFRYASRFHRRRNLQKGLRCLKDRACEETARYHLEARRADRKEQGCRQLARSLSHAAGTMVAVRFAKWKA